MSAGTSRRTDGHSESQWKAERIEWNEMENAFPDPSTRTICPLCSTRRSTSSSGRIRLILGPDFHDAVDAPDCMLGVCGGGTRNRNFQSLKLIGDFGAPSRQLVIQADCEVRPSLRV